MTETCRNCRAVSGEFRRRSHHIAVWCVGCGDWCQPGKWIPHVTLLQAGVDTTAVAEAPVAPGIESHPSLFDAA